MKFMVMNIFQKSLKEPLEYILILYVSSKNLEKKCDSVTSKNLSFFYFNNLPIGELVKHDFLFKSILKFFCIVLK